MVLSLFARLYQSLVDQIESKVPEIRYINMDLGQLEYYDTRPGVDFPCVLIDFPSSQFEDQSQNVQWGNLNIQIRLGFAPFSSTSNITPVEFQSKGLNYFELEHKLYGALQAFTAGDIIQPMSRVAASTERREDEFRVREMMFTSAAMDDSAMIPPGTVVAGLGLEEEISMGNDVCWQVEPDPTTPSNSTPSEDESP